MIPQFGYEHEYEETTMIALANSGHGTVVLLSIRI
jgi:hypothetical protein